MGKDIAAAERALNGNVAVKQPTEIRWTMLWVMLISMGLIAALTFIYTGHYVALVGAASSLLGGLGGIIKQLISPDKLPPDPLTDQGRVTPRGYSRMMVAIFGETPIAKPQDMTPAKAPQLRSNLLLVMVFGSIFVIFLALVLPEPAAIAVIALANGLMGYGIGSMLVIVTPTPPEPDPVTDEGWITPGGVEEVATTGRRLIGEGAIEAWRARQQAGQDQEATDKDD